MARNTRCNANPVAKWIRVAVSLAIIGAGIYYKNWAGLLGIVTLISAFTGSCPLSIHFHSPERTQESWLRSIRIRRSDIEE